jgi:hypothetical protein
MCKSILLHTAQKRKSKKALQTTWWGVWIKIGRSKQEFHEASYYLYEFWETLHISVQWYEREMGKLTVNSFLKRIPHFVLRYPGATTLARAMNFSRANINTLVRIFLTICPQYFMKTNSNFTTSMREEKILRKSLIELGTR